MSCGAFSRPAKHVLAGFIAADFRECYLIR
jgi:hypothetical protein